MKIHLLSGFLGSGKTTLLLTAAGLLAKKGAVSAAITNDQGMQLVDAGFLAASGLPGGSVRQGCFCCNYSDLDRQLSLLESRVKPDVVFAESVGSCTDIVATVLKPLRRFHSGTAVTLTTVVDARLLRMLLRDGPPFFAEEVAYIFWKQIEEADRIVLNKTDLVVAGDVQTLSARLTARFGAKQILPLQANRQAAVTAWLHSLDSCSATEGSLVVDYDRYAAGEALMGWLDQEIFFPGEQRPGQTAGLLVRRFNHRVRQAGWAIGHIKWLADDRHKISETALQEDTADGHLPGAGTRKLLLNARVQADPQLLAAVLEEEIGRLRAETGTRIDTGPTGAFRPGYPRPEHRLG